MGVRIGLSQVRGITEAESGRIAAGQPYTSVEDFWERARPSRPLAERLAKVGALSAFGPRRKLLLTLAELHRSRRGTGDPPPVSSPWRTRGARRARRG